MSTSGLMEALFDYRADLILWTLSSVGIYAVGVNLLHFLHSPSSGRFGLLLRTFEAWPHSYWFFQALRFLYYLCIPYVALTRGATNPTLMGMWATDWFEVRWFEGIALGMTLGLGTLIILCWGWRHCLRTMAEIRHWPQGRPFLAESRTLLTPWGWGLILLEVLYLEIHWAFYRGATVRLLGDYYGVFLSFLLILAEWWLNPELRKGLGMTHRSGEIMTTVAIALSITTIYYFTSNLWLCIAIHLAIQFGLISFLLVSSGSTNYEPQNK
jgi:hypothetical protein